MNISLTNTDNVSGILKMEIVKADYADQVEKSLRSFRQKANIPGFRKGMVPMEMIKKMYGKHVMAEEVNKIVSDNLFKYIRENKVNILGEPLPNETEQKEIDFGRDEDFDFYFDLAFAPEIQITLNKRDKLSYYKVEIDDETLNKQLESYKANFGTYGEAEEVEEKDLVKGVVVELDNGEPKEGGIVVEDAVLMPLYMKDDDEKARFIGAAKNSVVVFNPNKAYEGAEAELSSFLKIAKEEVAAVTSDFSFEINEITRHHEAEINQELFDKVFGEGEVTTEEEFKEKVKAQLAEQFEPQSNYKFLIDARQLLLKKAGKVDFAEDFLKRWLQVSDEKKTKEQIDEEYPKIIEDLTYHLIKEDIVKKNEFKVEDADIEEFGKKLAKAQFAQYGMMSVPDDILDNYAKDMLKNRETLQNVIDRVIEEKMTEWLKEQVKLDVKEVSAADFNKLFD